MPQGLAGLFSGTAMLWRRFGVLRLLPLMASFVAATALLAGGTAFVVEVLRRLFSRDYRAMLGADPSAPWPAIPLYGVDWAPGAISTWLVPVVLLGVGGALAYVARRWLQGLLDEREGGASLASVASTASPNVTATAPATVSAKESA
jgi:branched-chain amino acid transport system permease protein